MTRTMCLLALVGLIPCTTLAAAWGIAALAVRVPVAEISSWRLRQFDVPPADWERAEVALHRALGLDQNNPEYLNELGRVDLWRHAEKSAANGADHALHKFRQSAKLRPTWPYTWINLALAKSASGRYDLEFSHALRRASRTGPWERPIQRAILHAGLANWPVLPAEAQRTVMHTVRRALVAQPTTTMHLLAKYRRADLLDALVAEKPFTSVRQD